MNRKQLVILALFEDLCGLNEPYYCDGQDKPRSPLTSTDVRTCPPFFPTITK